MSEAPSEAALCRMSFLLLCILGMTLVTSGFPQPGLPLRSAEDSEETKRPDRDVLYPSISLRDWSIQMLSAPSLRAAADSKAGLVKEAWLFDPERTEAGMGKVWPAEWSSQGARMVKRNMVVADDAAFREKSKLLTSMERQKWLNSYMQKLLVVNSS
ncbi:tuberoinfundibular peptide of 39 residues [Hippoglossus hippoglossus]|uniref:tuberoinfundibular peptide of 39 residues n=1 Tax=Hippoglossus hippoglossus TaxID=8267 RepID=UPI00148E3588|nr:tuberoinfundibular peptide of 39 residues [Hippoglossus hippoglossus]XP_047197671.1 tuberoinfundibular peptide of 39 residues [Hippoglossus stenolepis]